MTMQIVFVFDFCFLFPGIVPDDFVDNDYLVNITLFDNRLSCALPHHLIGSNRVHYGNTTVMFLLGNQFSTGQSDTLPDYVNPDFGKAVNLYFDVYEMGLQHGVLYFSLLGCIPMIMLYRGRGVVFRFLKANRQSAHLDNLEDSDSQFFEQLDVALNAMTHWMVIIFVMILIVLYGLYSSYFECGNVYLHFSLTYLEGNELIQTILAVLVVAADALILVFIFRAYRRDQDHSNGGMSIFKRIRRRRTERKKERINEKRDDEVGDGPDGAMDIPQHTPTPELGEYGDIHDGNRVVSAKYSINSDTADSISTVSEYSARNGMVLEEDFDSNLLDQSLHLQGTDPSRTPSYIREDRNCNRHRFGSESESRNKNDVPFDWLARSVAGGSSTKSALDLKMQAVLFDTTSDSVKHQLPIEDCNCCMAMVYVFLWLFTLSTTVVFFVTVSLPYNNTLHIGEWTMISLEYCLGFVLSVCNIFIVPKISDYIIFAGILLNHCCCCCWGSCCCRNRGPQRKRHIEHNKVNGYDFGHIYNDEMVDDVQQKYYTKLVNDFKREEDGMRIESQLSRTHSVGGISARSNGSSLVSSWLSKWSSSNKTPSKIKEWAPSPSPYTSRGTRRWTAKRKSMRYRRYKEHRRSEHYLKRKYMTSSTLYRFRSIITALLRSVNLVWIPFVVALFFENNCGGGWSLFWDPCLSFYDGESMEMSELTVSLDLSGTAEVCIEGGPTIFNLTDRAPVIIPYGSVTPMLTPGLFVFVFLTGSTLSFCLCTVSIVSTDSVCFDRSDLTLESLTATSDCIRAVLSVWTNILIIKMCSNIGILCLSALSMQCTFTRNRLWLKMKPHVRMDKEYASILSHLEIAIVIGFITPIIMPIIAVVIIVTIYFYKMSLRMGRDLRKSDIHFPMLFLCYPVIFQQCILAAFYRIAQFEGSIIVLAGFIVIDSIFVIACVTVKCR